MTKNGLGTCGKPPGKPPASEAVADQEDPNRGGCHGPKGHRPVKDGGSTSKMLDEHSNWVPIQTWKIHIDISAWTNALFK